MRIAIADEYPMCRLGLQEALEADADMRVVVNAADGHELLRRAQQCRAVAGGVAALAGRLPGEGERQEDGRVAHGISL